MKTSAPLAALAVLAFVSCSSQVASSSAAAAGSAPASGPDAVVAELKGARITAGELDKRIEDQLRQLRQQEYDLRRQALDQMVAELLFKRAAEARGVKPEDLLKAEVFDKVPAPGPAELQAAYEKFKPQLGGRTLEQIRPDLERYLRQRATDQRLAEFRRSLAAQAGVKVLLEVQRAQVRFPADAPATGPKEAAVTLVEYTDFQCPYCRKAQETVDELMARYPGKLRLVHRDYPIEGHPRARPAAQAAYCAGEQGQFWEFRRNLLVEAGDLGDEDLKRRAAAFKLDTAAFGSCLGSTRHADAISTALAEGQALGVNSTPTFFINGRTVTGAHPLEAFVDVIEEELAAGPRT